MDNASSPLDTLRQLKEMLDAGALTPAEFEALKQRLVLGPGTVPPAASPVPAAPIPALVLPLAATEPHSFPFEDVAAEQAPALSVSPPFSGAETAAGPPAPEPMRAASPAGWATDEFPDAEVPAGRNPLSLVLSIGGLLALLGLVLYLTLNRPPSEHISSTSQTAADSLTTAIETGPQAEQLPALPAVPETVRVAPAHPAPPLPARPAPVADSVAPALPAAADSAARQ